MTRAVSGLARGVVVILLAALLAGCGSGVYPVDGVVVWKDGSPAKELEGALVIFDLPEKQVNANGSVQADGTFRLTTNKPNDGAPAGDYKVVIVERRTAKGGPDPTEMAPGKMDIRYADPSTTDLRATVTAGSNKVKLTVERNKQR